MRERVKCIVKNNIIILAASVLVGFMLLLFVHLLPTERMKENVYWSKDTILAEFEDQLVIDGYETTMTGRFTDSLMLGHAIYKNEEHSVLERSMRMYRGESCPEEDPDAWWPGYSLIDYLDHVEQPKEVQYPRYWHGYLVFLKPLLMFTSLNGIRMINGVAMMLLLGAVMMSCGKQNKMGLGIAILASMPFLFFTTTFSSLSLSICYYIAMLATWAVLAMEKIKLHGPELFLVTGIATAYFDLLTYPLVTLCFPLCVYLYLKKDSVKGNLKDLLICTTEWGIGYGAMWASKWVLTDLLTGSRVIADAFETIFARIGSAEGGRFSGYLDVVTNNVQPFSNWSFGVLGLAILAYLIFVCIRNILKKSIRNWKSGVVYLVVALLPFIWWFIMQNHSEEHWVYTCRIFAITVLALIAGAMKVFKKEEETC